MAVLRGDAMTTVEASKADLVAVYLEIVLSGAPFEDQRLAVLREAMTADERAKAEEAIAMEILRREPVAGRAN